MFDRRKTSIIGCRKNKMPNKVALMVASGVIVVVVAGVVLLVMSQGGKPATYFAPNDNPNNYPGASLPTSQQTAPPAPPTASTADTDIPMECEMSAITPNCTIVTKFKVVPPHKYYWETACGPVKVISETVDGVNVYSYSSLLGSWYHIINSNPQTVDANYASAQELIRQFKEHNVLPAGSSITCTPLGADVPDSEFTPPLNANVTDIPSQM